MSLSSMLSNSLGIPEPKAVICCCFTSVSVWWSSKIGGFLLPVLVVRGSPGQLVLSGYVVQVGATESNGILSEENELSLHKC